MIVMAAWPPTNYENLSDIILPLDACLREAASAKAGGRIKVGVDKMPVFHPPLNPLPSREGRVTS